MFALEGKKIWIAGHNGMVGRALTRALEDIDCELVTVERTDLDLRDQAAVRDWLEENGADAVFLAAAKVGGIAANNDYPAEFIYDNLAIQNNVIHQSYKAGVKKLLFLGSSCIYPKHADQPICEDQLLSGLLEPTNEPYAVAKIAGIKMCQSYNRQYGTCFISALPCNLYGIGDFYDADKSHVIPALIMKMHTAKLRGDTAVQLWGTGSPLREFLYVDDLAQGLLHLMRYYEGNDPVNIGSGCEISVADLARKIAGVTGFDGRIEFDAGMPDGTMRKCLDNSKMNNMGWQAKTSLDDGLRLAYKWYCETNGGRDGKRKAA